MVVDGGPAALLAKLGTPLGYSNSGGYEPISVDPEQAKVIDSVIVGLVGCGQARGGLLGFGRPVVASHPGRPGSTGIG